MAKDLDNPRWRLIIERDRCIGAGACLALCPDHFELDDEARSRALTELIDADDDAIAAARSCPTEAIRIESADGGEPIYPEA
ncbi:MAG: ferredoxin [Myxococcota bacterium]